MEITLKKAKNGELTALADNHYLHSNYNPSREAERFINSLEIKYTPPLFILIEPCISYIIPILKKNYKNSKILVIRFYDEFNEFNQNVDYLINYFEHINDFEEYLYNILGEELLISSYIIPWPSSTTIFANFTNVVNNKLLNLLQKSKTLLVTREFFEKKWFINTINFLKYTKNNIILTKKINKPVVIISSGPSLVTSLKILKEKRASFFLICLSSAIKPLLTRNIIPDLCFSTDGGFWAGEHLKILNKYNIPIAVTPESFIPKNILKRNKILILGYSDGISSEICKLLNIQYTPAERNGTVSGTALQFALENSTSDIYFCGLDLACQLGYQHIQPNELEVNNKIHDNKLKSLEKRSVISQYSNNSLNIYRNWFVNLNLNNRKVYRIISNEYKQNQLGMIQDIDSGIFNEKLQNYKPNNIVFSPSIQKINKEDLITIINNNLYTDYWKKSLFPLSYTALTHNPDNSDIINKLNKKMNSLLKQVEKILDVRFNL